MPIYGDEKKKQMARSILPSKRKKGRRGEPNKADIQGAERSRVRNELNSIRCLEDAEHSEGEFGETRHYRSQIRSFVQNRREADKLNHFIHWTKVITVRNEIPKEDRRGYFKSVLPEGWIGDHALSHLEYPVLKADEITLNSPRWDTWRYKKQLSVEDLTARLTDLLHREGPSGLNSELHDLAVKKVTGYHLDNTQWDPPRMIEKFETLITPAPQLKGVSSIPSFIAEVFKALTKGSALPWYYNEQKGYWEHQQSRQYCPDWYKKVAEYTSTNQVRSRAIQKATRYKGLLILKRSEPTYQEYYSRYGKTTHKWFTNEYHIVLENQDCVPHNEINIDLLS